MSCVFIGHLTLDDVVYRNRGIYVKNNLGGATLYSACGAAVWGCCPSIVSVVGATYPIADFRSLCNQAGINTDYVRVTTGRGIELIIEYDENDEHEFIPKNGIDTYFDYAPKADDVDAALINSNNCFHITPIPVELQYEFVIKIKQQQKQVTIDPDIVDILAEKKEIWGKLLSAIDYLLISKKEILEFWRVFYPDFEADNSQYVSFLRKFADDFSIKNVILKLGKNGVHLLNENREIFHCNSCSVNLKDATGAGDSFAGGFCFVLCRNKDPLEGLRFGTVSASFAIEDFGFEHMLSISDQLFKNRLSEIVITEILT